MSPVVVDTDVASFLFKGDTRASGYRRPLENRQWTISFMTEAELEQWALLANWSGKANRVAEDPSQTVCDHSHFAGPCAEVGGNDVRCAEGGASARDC
mgnify:FL=1